MRNWFKRIFTNPAGPEDALPVQPETVEVAEWMHKADLSLERGDFVAASAVYRQVLAVDSRNIAALQKTGFALKQLGQLREAAAALSRSLEIDPALPYSHYLLGEIAEAEGNTAAAKLNWRKAIELAPDFDPAYQGMCRILFNEGALDEALQIATDGILHLPQSPDMHFCLGNLQYGKGQFEQAERAYLHALSLQSDRPDILAHLGQALIAQERTGAAIEAMRRALSLAPNRVDVQNSLANALFKAGSYDEALAGFARATAMEPANSNAWNDWGIALHKLERSQESIACLQRFLQQNAEDLPTLFNLANILHDLRQWEEAGKHYRRILEYDPQRVDVLFNLALNFRAAGDEAHAADCFRRALALQPGHVAANFNLGALLQSQGNSAAAIPCYEAVRAAQPEFLACRLNLGMAYHEQSRWQEAVAEFEYVLRLEPDHVDALGNLALTLQTQGSHDEAIARYRQALAVNPANHNILINLGVLYGGKERFAEALESYEQALLIAPDAIPAYINMAAAYGLQGRESDSLATYERALQIDPASADAHYSRSLILLRRGDFEEGWKEYEYRWLRSGATPKPEFPGKEWRGEEDLQGKTILLHAEQGLGDMIQFVRYVEQVAAKGAKVVLEVPGPLLPLLKDIKGVDDIALPHLGVDRPNHDFYCALLSLPAALKSTLATIPAHCPYVQAPVARVDDWKMRLAGHDAPRIGLVWAGNPGHKNDHYRSARLSDLASLWSDGKWKFLSLQKEVRAEDMSTLKGAAAITDLSSALTDFAETAAIISNLDLLITVDTSLAHLAGALGVPVWIMLPYLPDFRWLMERTDSPWYPSARLFRQSSLGNWQSVVDAIYQALSERYDTGG